MAALGVAGCTASGTLDDSRFNYPMPWIGLFVVAASSAVCALPMALDLLHGFRYRKKFLLFPCKFFSLNATTLTLMGAAVKLSLDLNTSMPRPHDQLAKLSSTAFICTAIANSMPSLGTMSNKELLMNVVALGILLVTVIVNVCIQLGTGVIYVFRAEHALVLFLILLSFAMLISSSLAIPATKFYLELGYSKKYHQLANTECCDPSSVSSRKLRDDLTRYWMMAQTCNPQFVMGRLATCTASGALCLLSAITLAEAILRTYLMPWRWSFTFCKGESDYKWSTMVILVTQTIAVAVGTIAPASRWFISAIQFLRPMTTKPIGFSHVERYWIKKFCLWKEYPLDVRICGQLGRRFVHNAKNLLFDLCIFMQKGVVVLSKAVRLISIMIASQYLRIHRLWKKLANLVAWNNNEIFNRGCDAEPNPNNSCGKLDLRHYVLHLEGEEELVDVMMECDKDAPGHWIGMGRERQPKYLLQLLKKLNLTRKFEGVHKFDSIRAVPSLASEEPPNSWALPVVTLTSIAVAISKDEDDFNLAKQLIKCVHQGLKYVRVVESNLDIKRDLSRVRKAAGIVWNGVDLHYKWLDVDLLEMARQGKCPVETISQLSEIAKNKFLELKQYYAHDWFGHSPSKWPFQVLAANSMYRICQTLVLTTDNNSDGCNNNEVIFGTLTSMITDIIGACLTNLQHAIAMKCHQSSIEQREECVRSAILLLGKTERILEILSNQQIPSSDPRNMACINEWRALSRERDEESFKSSTEESTSPDLYLDIQ